MEVHHHSHPSAGPGTKKKWTHYFWEFLMLFLAVFCGFLAEYQLEHTIENKREIVYIKSMIEDLQKDTAQLNYLEKAINKIGKSLDTVLLLFSDLGNPSNLVLNRNIYAVRDYPEFVHTDRTIQQLKSSGGMRLIRKRAAAGGILNYDNDIRNYQISIAWVDNYYQHFTQLRISILNFQLLDNRNFTVKTPEEILNDKQNYLLTTDPVKLNNFKSSVYELRVMQESFRRGYRDFKANATALIITLKKEYQIQ
jgi:hypothetical protein